MSEASLSLRWHVHRRGIPRYPERAVCAKCGGIVQAWENAVASG